MIQDSSIKYHRPVASDFAADCPAPGDEAVARLLATLTRRGRGRIALQVTVSDAQGPAVAFSGRYVVHRTDASATG